MAGQGAGGMYDQFTGEGQGLAEPFQGGVAEGNDIEIGGGLDIGIARRMGAPQGPCKGGGAGFVTGQDLQDGVACCSDRSAQDSGYISGTDNNGLHAVFL